MAMAWPVSGQRGGLSEKAQELLSALTPSDIRGYCCCISYLQAKDATREEALVALHFLGAGSSCAH